MNVIAAIIILFVVLLFSLYATQIKGYIGERQVSLLLSQLDSSKYKIINDVVLITGGKTSQIDHLVISDYGIFVIETKNYKGWILGSDSSQYWTQVLYKTKQKFYNPVLQNAGHINAIKTCLRDFPKVKYISIIVFTKSAEIKTNTEIEVIHPNNLISTIIKQTEINLSENEKAEIFKTISNLNTSKKFIKEDHIQFINQKIEARNRLVKERKCPQCGNQLQHRNGKFGDILGCSTYPKCKYTTKL